MKQRVLLLAPSRGLGGGIERYLSTIEAAFDEYGVAYRRINLTGPDQPGGLRNKLRFVREVWEAVRNSPVPVRLIVAHNHLLPVVPLVAALRAYSGSAAILYGCEIWAGRRPRGWRTMRRRDVQVVTISNFSAGALAGALQANVNVLPPGISPDWYRRLVTADTQTRRTGDELSLVTAFRLNDWRQKGLDTLFKAIAMLDDDRIRLTVCGSGSVPADLVTAVASRPWCRIAANLSDDVLAGHLASADLFVLATHTSYGRRSHGEGFGLVLVEAQLAGTPVVAPAHGGSADTFQYGITGLAPTDESPQELAAVLGALLNDDRRLTEMGRAAGAWSRVRFEPTGYSAFAVESLLGRAAVDAPSEESGLRHLAPASN